MTLLGLRAYARHRAERGLPGQSHGAVRKAIDRGTLRASVSRSDSGRELIDPEKADGEWTERTDPAQQREPEQSRGRFSDGHDAAESGSLFPDLRPPPTKAGDLKTGDSLRTAQAVRLSYQARLAQLEYEERSARLCKVKAVKVEGYRIGRLVRDKVLNVADRISAQLAAESDQHACRELLMRELNVALQALAETGRQEYSDGGPV